MKLFHSLSLRSKITFIIVGTVTFILATAFSVHLYSELSLMKGRLLSEKALTARIVGNYSATDISFDNKTTALESLSYLKGQPSIINAHLFDSTGKYFVSLYENRHAHNDNLNNNTTWHSFDKDNLDIIEPIFIDDQKIGSIYLHTSIAPNIQGIKDRIIFLSLFLITLVIVAILIAKKMSEIVSQPILTLATAAENYAKNKDASTPLDSQNKDETGRLINAFNKMLAEIKIRESETAEAHEQLKENEQNLKLILNNMVDSVITFDESGTILSTNHSADSLFGYTTDEIINQNINHLIPDYFNIDHNEYLQDHTQSNKKKIITLNKEMQGLHKNKNTFPVRLAVTELPTDTHGKRCFIGTCQDLTYIKKQEQLLQRTQKMNALGKLTGGIAHDYNNMLGVVTGYAELLEEALYDQPKLAKYAHQIHHAGKRGVKLTKKLLSFSRKKPTEEKQVNINTLLHDVRHMLETTLTVRINLIFELDENLWPAWLDISDLEDSILNMCINAMHSIEDSGQLTFQTQNIIINSLDAKQLDLTKGEYIALSITDTGSGMDQNTKDKMFDPFYSTKGDDGTGLGLSQVYGFIKRSDGAIKVYSEPGHGTRFVLYFPRHTNTKLETIPDTIKNTKNLTGKETILLVDDEPALVSLSFEILSQHGYHVICANNAKQAIHILEHESIDLLLSDVIMPEMDGYQLASFVREEYPEVKIQLASGFSDNRHKDMLDDDLHRNLLNKPLNTQVLLKKLRELLD